MQKIGKIQGSDLAWKTLKNYNTIGKICQDFVFVRNHWKMVQKMGTFYVFYFALGLKRCNTQNV